MDYPKSLSDVYLYEGKFTDGTSDGVVAPSRDPAAWANAVTDEILNVIRAAGLVPEEADVTQLMQAVQALAGASVPMASEIVAGRVELANNHEALAGQDLTRAVHPAGLVYTISQLAPPVPVSSEIVAGRVELASIAETQAGADAVRAVHPAGLKSALGNFRSVPGLSGTVTLTDAHMGAAALCSSATLTLPRANSVAAGAALTLLNTGGSAIYPPLGDELFVVDLTTFAPGASINGPVRAVVISDGNSRWYLHRGDIGTGVMTQNGFFRLPGGPIIQWGSGSASGAISHAITFPITYPTVVLNASATNVSGTSSPMTYMAVGNLTTSGMSVNSTVTSPVGFMWMSIGY